MNKLEGYIPKDKRKNILLLADDMRLHSGIATMARSIVEGNAHKFNWIQLGAALKDQAGAFANLGKGLVPTGY